MKIILVDDNHFFRESINFFIETKLGYEVIGSYKDGEEFLNSKEYYNTDIVLMDIDMPRINGIKAAKLALWKAKDIKIIAITGFREKAYLDELIGAGCKGCVFKDDIYDELNAAIKKVYSGDFYYPDNIKIRH